MILSYLSVINELSLPASIGDASRKLRNAGWREAGQGVFGTVFLNPNKPYVLKLFKVDHAYQRFLKLIRSQPDNPHFPKLRGLPMKVNDEYSAVRMEKLEKHQGHEKERHQEAKADLDAYLSYSSDLRQRIRDLRDAKDPARQEHIHNKIREINKKLEPIIKERPELVKSIDDIYHKVIKPTGANFDLHGGNIMWRGKTMVITDPVAFGRPTQKDQPLPPAERQFSFVFDKPREKPKVEVKPKEEPFKVRTGMRFGAEPPKKKETTLWRRQFRAEQQRRARGEDQIDAAARQQKAEWEKQQKAKQLVNKHFAGKRNKKNLLRDMLLRKEGCTKREVLKATGWGNVSIAGQAHIMGIEVRKVKEWNSKGKKETRYYGRLASRTIQVKRRKKFKHFR